MLVATRPAVAPGKATNSGAWNVPSGVGMYCGRFTTVRPTGRAANASVAEKSE